MALASFYYSVVGKFVFNWLLNLFTWFINVKLFNRIANYNYYKK